MYCSPICTSCRGHIRNRLRHRILLLLQSRRRSFHATSVQSTGTSKPANSRSWYWDTVPPTSKDLASATQFFQTHLPRKLWTATEWRRQNQPVGGTLIPEVAFLGRSNVGKSSLLNALLLSPQLNHVGPRPGKTTIMHAWGLAASDPVTGGARRGHSGDTSIKIAVLDMPGYGHASHGEWGQEITTYLKRRKQLTRVFVLLDALHGVKPSDLRMLDLLRKKSISHQVIASKCDRLGKNADAQTALNEALGKMRNAAQPASCAGGLVALGEILAIGAVGDGRKNDRVSEKTMMGIDEVRYAVLKATGLESTKSFEIVIPAVEGKEILPRSEWNSSTDLRGDKAAVSTQTPLVACGIGHFAEEQGDGGGPLPCTETVLRKHVAEDGTRAIDGTPSVTFDPVAADYPRHNPPSLPNPRRKLPSRLPPPPPPPPPPPSPPPPLPPPQATHPTRVDQVLPYHNKAATLANDPADQDASALPSISSQGPLYAGSIGYGLRDLYEMTATERSGDQKAIAPRQQQRRRRRLRLLSGMRHAKHMDSGSPRFG